MLEISLMDTRQSTMWDSLRKTAQEAAYGLSIDDGGDMEFKELNREMSRKVLESLIARGHIDSEEDGLRKLKDSEWLGKHGYSHVAHILTSNVGAEACRAIFMERRAR